MKNHNSNSNLFYGDSRNHVITWDDKQQDFYPQVKVLNLDNFNNFSLRLDEEKTWGSKHTFVRDGIEAGRNSKSFLENQNCKNECYTTSDLFEWLIHIKKKPTTNKVYFSVNTKNAEFYPQGPLTEQEVAEGCIRPDDIVGSLAVYSPFRNHVIGDLNHMAGKVGHIPAPYVIMPDASRVKCDMYFEESWLVIEIPLNVYKSWDFDSAALLLDPTLGYTSVGGSYNATYNLTGNRFTTSEAGTAVSISVYMRSYSYYKAVCGLYSGTSKVAQVAEFDIDNTAQWRTNNLTTSPSMTASTEYGIVTDANQWVYYCDYTSGNTYISKDATYSATMANTIDFSVIKPAAQIITAYLTYTAASSSSIKKYFTVAQASIKKANTVAVANVKKLLGVANT